MNSSTNNNINIDGSTVNIFKNRYLFTKFIEESGFLKSFVLGYFKVCVFCFIIIIIAYCTFNHFMVDNEL